MQAHGGGHGKARQRDPSASSGRRLRGTASAAPPEPRRRVFARGEDARRTSDGAYDDQYAPDYQMGPDYQEGPDYRMGPDYQEAPDDGGREQVDEGDQSISSSDYYDGPHRRRSRGWCPGKCACCIGFMAVVLIPLLYIMFPYIKANIDAAMVAANATAANAAAHTPSTTLSTSRVTSAPSLKTSTTSPTTVKSTQNAREKIEHDCVKESPSAFDAANIANVNAAPLGSMPAAPAGGPQPVYCIYNVTRLPRGRFLPRNLPLAMCPSVVYWSWSLPGGVLRSRAKNFDETYGLGAIGDAAHDQKVHVEVLLALGGFREDSADFHKVGRDPIARQRLVQDLFSAFTIYNLSGITLHWVPNSRLCEDFYGGGVPQMSEFVTSVRRLVSLNMPGVKFKVAAMVDPREKSEMEFLRALRSYLNLTFFNTHQLFQSDTFANYCTNSIPVFHSQLALLKVPFQKPAGAASPPSNPYEGVCVSFSLSLHARQGGNIDKPAAAQPLSATTGYMALFEVCDSQAKFNGRVPIISGCIVKRTAPPLDVMIAYDNADTLRRKMSYFGMMKDLCVMLYDVDFDNYRNACTGHWELFLMMRHFYSGRAERSQFNLLSYLP